MMQARKTTHGARIHGRRAGSSRLDALNGDSESIDQVVQVLYQGVSGMWPERIQHRKLIDDSVSDGAICEGIPRDRRLEAAMPQPSAPWRCYGFRRQGQPWIDVHD